MEIVCGKSRQVIDVPTSEAKDYELNFRLIRGTRTFDISFINDYYVAGKADRNLHIHHVRLRGEERQTQLASPEPTAGQPQRS